MGLYENIKDIADVLRKADNIELYRQLLDLGSQALDMQQELYKAQERIAELENEKKQRDKIERHGDGLYISVAGEDDIRYCSTCWGKNGQLIQLNSEGKCFECQRNWMSAFNK